jgi:hypothetical protein
MIHVSTSIASLRVTTSTGRRFVPVSAPRRDDGVDAPKPRPLGGCGPGLRR